MKKKENIFSFEKAMNSDNSDWFFLKINKSSLDFHWCLPDEIFFVNKFNIFISLTTFISHEAQQDN